MECASPKPPLPGEVARRSRDGEVAANLIQPLSQPSAASSPARGALSPRRANPSGPSVQLPLTRGAFVPRKKVKLIKISAAPSIDGNRSKATSHKLDAPVSGGAYQDARKVSLVWNARPKHWNPPEFKCRKHPTVTQRPFSPPSFPARRKRRGRRRHRAVASLRQPLSLGCAEPAPLKGEPFGVLDSLAILKSGTNHRRYVL